MFFNWEKASGDVYFKNVRFIFEQVQPPIPPPAPTKNGWLTARRGRAVAAARPRTLPVKPVVKPVGYVYVDGNLRPSCQYAPPAYAPAPAAPAAPVPSCSYVPAAPVERPSYAPPAYAPAAPVPSCSSYAPAAPAPVPTTPARATAPAPGPVRMRRWRSTSSVADEVRTNGGVRTTRNPRLVELSEVRKLIVRFACTKRVYSTLRPRHCPQGAVNALKRGYAGCNGL